MPDADQPTERTQRYTVRIHWICAVLTAAVGGFLVDDVTRSGGRYNAGAWVGVALSALAILALFTVYVGCALGRLHMDQRLAGKLTLFQSTALCVVVAVGADVLIPARDTGGLALLLPWGLSYWLHHLERPAE